MEKYKLPKEKIELIKFTQECINNENNSKVLLNHLYDNLVENQYLELAETVAKYFLTKFPDSINMEYKLSILILNKGLIDDDVKRLKKILIKSGKKLLNKDKLKKTIITSLINWIINKSFSSNPEDVK